MPKIALLSPQVANMIAAGEVVERPASVIKELIENSIDANASHITVEIKNGGITYMRVTDDGTGISCDDVSTAFLRHATSKISKASDLESIKTMGFRGEALAALASVSHVDMFTKTHTSDTGTHISIEGGKTLFIDETGCADGTNIVVRDLFYNVPARFKFLKKDTTEAAKIEDAVICAAISAPSVSFTFIKDGKDCFSTSGNGKIKDVLYSAYGKEVVENLVFLSTERNGVSLNGYVGKPSLSRANRNLQCFFINGRPVRGKILTAAVDEAYKGKLMTGRFPVYFLMINASPSSFDVNIHPQKLEVKFNYERDVFVLLRDGVKSALETVSTDEAFVPEQSIFKKSEGFSVVKSDKSPYIYQTRLDEDALFHDKNIKVHNRAAFNNDGTFAPSYNSEKWTSPIFKNHGQYSGADNLPFKDKIKSEKPFTLSDKAIETKNNTESLSEKVNLNDVKIIGEFFRTYVIAEYDGCIWLIDKHAAHERFIYNSLLSNKPEAMAQYLLKPCAVSLSRVEKDILLSNSDFLEKAGFEVSDSVGSGLMVRCIPSYISESEIEASLSEIAEKLLDHKTAENDKLDEIYKSIACKSAVKAGMKNDMQELRKLIIHTLVCDDMKNCPHGRPTVLKITEQTLEKMFKRTL